MPPSVELLDERAPLRRGRMRIARPVSVLLITVAVVGAETHRASADAPDPWNLAQRDCDRCTSMIESAGRQCALKANKAGKFGDVLVRLEPIKSPGQEKRMFERVRASAEATDGLEKDDARCVKDKIDALACAGACYTVQESTLDIPLSEPRPLLPPVSELLPVWRRYLDSSCWLTSWWRRRALRRMLTADLRVTPERCLWIPQADNLRAGLRLWLAQSGKEIPSSVVEQLRPGNNDSRWPMRWDSGRIVEGGQTILVDDGPLIDAASDWREYDGSAGIRVCLVSQAPRTGA